MNTNHTQHAKGETSRIKLLNAALGVIRAKGYSATTVDELCAAAGVSKGAFFHNFASKEALAVEAANHWSDVTSGLFASAAYHQLADPLDRVMGYLDLREQLLDGPVEEFTCLVGTMVQEAFGSSDAIRAACEVSIAGHAQKLESDISEALASRAITGVSARSLALHTQAVLQGAFILAKAMGGPAVARDSVVHLKRYVEMLFTPPKKERSYFMKITIETIIRAPIAKVWGAYVTPADIKQWNTASDDWHTTTSTVDLREGGAFCSRMEAKDGSFGFDFAGTYTKIVPHELIEYSFGDRTGSVEFLEGDGGVTVRSTFDAETENSIEQQRGGWLAILNNFARHVEAEGNKS